MASTPVTGPTGTVSGGAAIALGTAQIASGVANLSRGSQQINEALDEPFDAASAKNLLGLLPAGQEFDDPCEPTPGEFFGGLFNDFVADPAGAALRAAKAFFAFE